MPTKVRTALGVRFGALAVAALLCGGPASACGAERPSPLVPYRYLAPTDPPGSSVREQEAYSYRNELAEERLRRERGARATEDAALRLRRQGEVNREIDRVDRLLGR